MPNGYVIEDPNDFSLRDFLDATNSDARSIEDSCSEEFECFVCTRRVGHIGPHAAATSPNTITAIWENE